MRHDHIIPLKFNKSTIDTTFFAQKTDYIDMSEKEKILMADKVRKVEIKIAKLFLSPPPVVRTGKARRAPRVW